MAGTESFQIEFSADPKPEKGANSKSDKRPVGRPSNASKKKEIKDQIYMMISVFSVPILVRDPICGGALKAQSSEISESLAELALQNPRLMKWLEALTSPSGWIGLGIALQPVAMTVIEHHVMHKYDEPEMEFPINFTPPVGG